MFLPAESRHRNPLMSQSAIMPGTVISHRPLENINCILEIQPEMGALYLGDVISTLKDNILEMNKIKAVLTCMAQNHHLTGKNIHHKVLPIKDTLEYPIFVHFDQAVEWIQQKRRQGINVLVHCHAGVSRSATIVTAYLMRFKGWPAITALNYVRSRRQRAKPNANFWNQLNQYEQMLNSKKEQNCTENKLMNDSKLTQNNITENSSPTRQYRRRKIFQTPPIHQNHHLLPKNIVSTECLPPTLYHDRHSQSINFSSQSELYGNRSAVQHRVMDSSMIFAQSRILTPTIQWQGQSNSPQISMQYNSHYAYKQNAVSPFELGKITQ